MATSVGAQAGAQPSGLAAISRAVVSAAAELVMSVERAMVGDARIRTARGNAWDAILEDRARARARDEMEQLVRALTAGGARATARVDAAAATPAPAEVPTGRSSTGRTRNSQAGTGQARNSQPRNNRTRTGQAGNSRSRTHQPRTHQPRTHEPRTHEPRTHEPRTGQTRTDQTRTVRPVSGRGPHRARTLSAAGSISRS